MTLCLSLVAGCASTGAKAPEQQLRPMNQDLAAWLQRLNAAPAALGTPAGTPTEPSNSSHNRNTNMRSASQNKAMPEPVVVKVKPTASHLQSRAAVQTQRTPAPALTHAAAPVASMKPSSNDPGPKASTGERALDLARLQPNAKPVAIKPAPPPEWIARADTSLKQTLEQWAKRQGWVVIWDAEVDLPIVTPVRYSGSLQSVVTKLFGAISEGLPGLRADLYNTQKIIHVYSE